MVTMRMESSKNEEEEVSIRLGARLAARYAPNQILTSTQSWGSLMGVEQFRRLFQCFSKYSISDDGDPALTNEWTIHFVVGIIDARLNVANCSGDPDEDVNMDLTLTMSYDSNWKEYIKEVEEWVNSLSIRLDVHDALWDACELSNKELLKLLLNDSKESRSGSLHSQDEEDEHSSEGSESATIMRVRRKGRHTQMVEQASAGLIELLQKKTRTHSLVRWSDITNNFVRDYEHSHDFGDETISYTQICDKVSSGRYSKDSRKDNEGWPDWARARKDKKRDGKALWKYEIHLQSPDHVLVAPLSAFIITSSKDGFVKVWSAATGAFVRNLFNTGSSWVIGMYLLMDEDYILISTTNNQLTLLDFSSGDIIQKYVGCESLLTACNEVNQPSAQDVQRYGMRPGECGLYRIRLRENEQSIMFHRRRRDAQKDVLPKKVLAKPVVGFLNPTATWFEPHLGMFCFGTAEGKVGAFDVSADVRASALLSGANTKPVRLEFLVTMHKEMVSGLFYSSYATSIFTAGADGFVYRLPVGPSFEPAGEPRRIGHQMRAIRSMEWIPPSKYFITVHVNRRVSVWVIGRHGDPFRSFPPESQEILSASMHPHRGRLAVLLADKTIKVYEVHASKSIATIQQPEPQSNFTASDFSRQMMERSERDSDGVVAWHPFHSTLICALRGPVLYAASKSKDSSSSASRTRRQRCEGATAQSTGAEFGNMVEEDDGEVAEHRGAAVRDSRQPCSHSGGVVAAVIHKASLMVHTFDEGTWRAWKLTTGEMKRHVVVSHAVRMGDISRSHATVASCSWSTSSQVRLVTGGQDCSLITWDPETYAPLESEMLVQDASDQLDSDVFTFSHQSKLIAWAARTCRVTTYSRKVLPSGVEESKSVVFRVPGLTSITACCVARDTYLCIGTGDGTLYVYSIGGGHPIAECRLREQSEARRGAVLQLAYVNEQGQNLIVAVLDTGVLCIYSFVTQTVISHLRLIRRFDCHIRKALFISDDGLMIYGDSRGRVCGFDLHAVTTPAAELQQFVARRFVFSGASDEVTTLEVFSFQGHRFIIVGSLDRQVRLFRIEDALRKPSLSNSGLQPAGWSFNKVLLVGVFGRDRWDLEDVTTYAGEPSFVEGKQNCNTMEEVLVESIMKPENSFQSIMNVGAAAAEDGASVPLSRGKRVSVVATTIMPPGTPSVPSFFLTEATAVQGDVACPTTPSSSIQDSMEQLAGQPTCPQTVPVISEGASCSGAPLGSEQTALPQGQTRRSHSHPRSRAASSTTSSAGDESPTNAGNHSLGGSSALELRGSLSGKGSARSHFSSEVHDASRAKAVLVSLTSRLDKVRPYGYARGAFRRKLQGLLPGDGDLSMELDQQALGPSTSSTLRLALETRRRLSERMDEYKRRQEEMKKRRKFDYSSCFARSVLPPVVIPKPSMISPDLMPTSDWMVDGMRKQTQLQPSVTASTVGRTV